MRKLLSETKALSLLSGIREGLRKRLRSDHEYKAKNCLTCPEKGVCCTDRHFVNVRITRLEANAICRVIAELDEELREKVVRRISDAAEIMTASGGFFSCPLFEKNFGCLVHRTAKPLPCIFHACYENFEDLPPQSLLDEAEAKLSRLNKKVYGSEPVAVSLPAALATRIFSTSNAASGRREPSSDKASEQR